MVVEGYERLKTHLGIESETSLCGRMTRVVRVDERILSALDIALVSQEIQGGLSPTGNCRRFLIGHVDRFHGKCPILWHAEILGISAIAGTGISVNLVPYRKSGYIFANGFNFSG